MCIRDRYMAAAIEKTLYGGVSGAAGEGQSAQNAKSRDHSAWISIAWIAGVLLVGACVYGVEMCIRDSLWPGADPQR